MTSVLPANNNIKVILNKGVIEKISSYIKEVGFSKEVGGIFLGKWRAGNIEIIDATFPGVKDESSKYRFYRKDAKHQYAAIKAWEQDDKKVGFIGEWHTHPENHPKPSSIDISTWKNLYKAQKSNMVFIIFGKKSYKLYLINSSEEIKDLSFISDGDQYFCYA